MEAIPSYQKIWDGTNEVTVGNLTIDAKGLNTVNLGVYKATAPTLTDGQIYPTRVDVNGALVVSASGAAVNDIHGWDNINSIWRKILVDSTGKLITIQVPRADVTTIQIEYGPAAAISPVAANQWQDILSYTVPTGYDLSPTTFLSWAGNNQQTARAVISTHFGTYNTATSVFTDGSSVSAPGFMADMYCTVTTQLGNVAVDNITITYVNQDGVGGRTATCTLTPKNAAVGIRILVTLQAGDFGVRDVTAVTHSQVQTGVFSIGGIVQLYNQVDLVASQQYESSVGYLGLSVNQGQTLILQYSATGAGAVTRYVSLLGTLIPRVT